MSNGLRNVPAYFTQIVRLAGVLLLVTLSAAPGHGAESLDRSVTQLILSIAPSWDAPGGRMQLFRRTGGGWEADGTAWPVLYGRNGLIWGRGVLGTTEPGPHKTERDKRSPAGVFRIGTIYTYDAALPAGSDFPFHTVTEADAWVDDSTLPEYNRFVQFPDPAKRPAWFEKEKMRQHDAAYRWLVEIRHNADPPVPGAGSAIFFHIRRGVDRPTAGCTTMAEADLERVIRWLRTSENPHFALLPKREYEDKWKPWGLPAPKEAQELLRPLQEPAGAPKR